MEHGKRPPERMRQRVATVGPSAARLVQELLAGSPYQHATVLHVPGFDLRPRQAALPLPRSRLPPDRRERRGGRESAGVSDTTRSCDTASGFGGKGSTGLASVRKLLSQLGFAAGSVLPQDC